LDPTAIKIFATLGVPGLAIGIVYVLVKYWHFRLPQVPVGWAGPIVVLIVLVIAGLTYTVIDRVFPPVRVSASEKPQAEKPPAEKPSTAVAKPTRPQVALQVVPGTADIALVNRGGSLHNLDVEEHRDFSFGAAPGPCKREFLDVRDCCRGTRYNDPELLRVFSTGDVVARMRTAVRAFNSPPAPNGCSIVMVTNLCVRVSFDDDRGARHQRHFEVRFQPTEAEIFDANEKQFKQCAEYASGKHSTGKNIGVSGDEDLTKRVFAYFNRL
jgi:hypothetical protein